MTRRHLTRGRSAIATALAVIAVSAATTVPAGVAQAREVHPNTSAAKQGSDDAPRLRQGNARQADLLPQYIRQLVPDAAQGVETQIYGHPAYPGVVELAARHGIVAKHFARGFAVRYATATEELPRDEWIPADDDTIYDLASLTKTFTAMVAIQLLADNRLELNEPVASYVPQFAVNGKGAITIRQLITHTSGLPADPAPPLWSPVYTDNDQRWAAVYATTPIEAPGAQYLYSDINYMTLGKVIEEVTDQSLATAVRRGITRPLGMSDTMFNPPTSLRRRIAATEYEVPPNDPDRGMVWGQVHDENAWAVGGVSGHAGLFSTAHDLAIYSQAILNRGAYGKVRIVPERWARTFFSDYNTAYPGNGHSLLMQTGATHFSGAMQTNRTIAHTGYTGTSIVIDPHTDSFIIQLTNRVHPNRAWTRNVSTNPQRRAASDGLARAVAVPPKSGEFSWFSGMANNPLTNIANTDLTQVLPSALLTPFTSSLTFPIRQPASQLTFNLWYRLIPTLPTVPGEYGQLVYSTDDGDSWRPLAFTTRQGDQRRSYLTGRFSGTEVRGWQSVTADLPAVDDGERLLIAVQYQDDGIWQGRGIYVNHIQAIDGSRVVFDDRRSTDAQRVRLTNGWQRSAD